MAKSPEYILVQYPSVEYIDGNRVEVPGGNPSVHRVVVRKSENGEMLIDNYLALKNEGRIPFEVITKSKHKRLKKKFREERIQG